MSIARNKFSGYNIDGRRTLELGGASAAVGIASGVSSLFGGDSGGGMSSSQAAQMADPFMQYRGQFGQQLVSLMNDPSSVKNLPGYQFAYDQGLNSLQRGMAATGQVQSGAEQIALSQYGEQFANQYFADQFNRLALLSGAQWQSGTGAAQSALNASAYNQNLQNQGYSAIMQGMKGLSNTNWFSGSGSYGGGGSDYYSIDPSYSYSDW